MSTVVTKEVEHMAQMIPITEARSRLAELIGIADTDDVLLMRHGRPAAVLLSTRRHAELMEQLDDLEDRIAVLRARDEPTIDFKALMGVLDKEQS